ncbi:hypothetical protein CTZ27_07135 [Streptomyces griseocarneus]|nr:hypothetical protein CTZ27_07135 [Streptomyces griseocarneus]
MDQDSRVISSGVVAARDVEEEGELPFQRGKPGDVDLVGATETFCGFTGEHFDTQGVKIDVGGTENGPHGVALADAIRTDLGIPFQVFACLPPVPLTSLRSSDDKL